MKYIDKKSEKTMHKDGEKALFEYVSIEQLNSIFLEQMDINFEK